MKSVLSCVLLISSAISYGQISIDTTSQEIYDPVNKPTIDWSQHLGASDTIIDSLTVFDTITLNEFMKYKRKYRSKIVADSSKHTWTDTSFTIRTENWTTTFNTKVTDDAPYNYYVGFLEPLNLFIVLNIDGHNELGTLVLIDKITGKNYFLGSGYDYPCETVYISPKNKYLLSYANNWAENNQCGITILKIVKTKNHFQLKGFNGLNGDQWTISDIAWINDQSIALSVKEKINLEDYGNNSGIIHYLRVTFDE